MTAAQSTAEGAKANARSTTWRVHGPMPPGTPDHLVPRGVRVEADGDPKGTFVVDALTGDVYRVDNQRRAQRLAPAESAVATVIRSCAHVFD